MCVTRTMRSLLWPWIQFVVLAECLYAVQEYLLTEPRRRDRDGSFGGPRRLCSLDYPAFKERFFHLPLEKAEGTT